MVCICAKSTPEPGLKREKKNRLVNRAGRDRFRVMNDKAMITV